MSAQSCYRTSCKRRRRSSESESDDVENKPQNDKRLRLENGEDTNMESVASCSTTCRMPLSEIPVDQLFRSSSQESLDTEYYDSSDEKSDSYYYQYSTNNSNKNHNVSSTSSITSGNHLIPVTSSPNSSSEENYESSNLENSFGELYVREEIVGADSDDDIDYIGYNEQEEDDLVNYDVHSDHNYSKLSEPNDHHDVSCEERLNDSDPRSLLDASDDVQNSALHYSSSPSKDFPEFDEENNLIDAEEEGVCNLLADNTGRSNVYSKTLTHMGQLTPVTPKLIPRMPHCPTWSSFRSMSVSTAIYSNGSECPVPHLTWTNRELFWDIMCSKDEASIQIRNPDLFSYQSFLKPRMRAILLDWISEVAEVYDLHRETFYLTVDYIDRYLSLVTDIQKQQLQLIGVTCLYIAAKMEEIYPPKIDVFASVTDGACTKEEIVLMEESILQNLEWLLSPLTINYWLEMLLQFIYKMSGKSQSSDMLTPSFSGALFKRLCRLMDLAVLDVRSLRYSHAVLAVTAIYLLVDPDIAFKISGLKYDDIHPCVQWMSVYSNILRTKYPEEMEDLETLPAANSTDFFGDSSPTRQKYTTSMEEYDLAQTRIEMLTSSVESNTPENVKNMFKSNAPQVNHHLLTPPPSCSKISLDMQTPASSSSWSHI